MLFGPNGLASIVLICLLRACVLVILNPISEVPTELSSYYGNVN